MNQYLEENHILTEHQSGFRNKHSCTTAILKFTEDAHKYIAKGKCIILVLLDFANAFGSVDHDTLIQILESVGVTGSSFRWFKSFLTGWQQTVKQNGTCSKSQSIDRGIIQGENNSQMLFSLFINNLVSYIKRSKKILFADDVQIYLECGINEIRNGIKTINDELENVIKFSNDYGIKINPSKTKAIIISSKSQLRKINYDDLPPITINGDAIEYVDEVRDLGYYLNRTLTSESHSRIIHKKVYGSLATIYPLKFLPTETKLQLVKTLILPIIDYMDIVYHDFDVHGTRGGSEKLEKLQNMCIRFILNVRRYEHITPRRNELNLMTLFDRRILHIASIIHKIIHREAPDYLSDIIEINSNNNRSINKLIIRKPANNFQQTSLHIGGPKMWNSIPNNIREISCNEDFVIALREYLDNKQ